MILSTTTATLDDKFGYEKAIEIIAKAGFDAVDLSLCAMGDSENVFNNDGYREYADKLLKTAKDNGVYFNQAHAYFPTSFEDEERTERAFQRVVRGIEIAGIIGADSLGYLPADRLCELSGGNGYCSACFEGNYPTEIPEDTGKNRFEQRLSERKKER